MHSGCFSSQNVAVSKQLDASTYSHFDSFQSIISAQLLLHSSQPGVIFNSVVTLSKISFSIFLVISKFLQHCLLQLPIDCFLKVTFLMCIAKQKSTSVCSPSNQYFCKSHDTFFPVQLTKKIYFLSTLLILSIIILSVISNRTGNF